LIAQQTTRSLVMKEEFSHGCRCTLPVGCIQAETGQKIEERDATIRLQAWLTARGNDRYRTDLEEERLIWLLSVWTSILLFIDPGKHVLAVELALAGHARCQ